MPIFDIECVDTTTFKVYTTAVTAKSLDEARQEAIRNGHKLSTAAQSLNPQLVPPSVQMRVPDGRSAEAQEESESNPASGGTSRMLIFIGIVVVAAIVAFIMRTRK